MQLTRNNLELRADEKTIDSRGAQNVDVTINVEGADNYSDYSTELHFGYVKNGMKYDGVCLFKDGKHLIPFVAFENAGPLYLSVHLVKGDVVRVTNQVSFVVKPSPNGSEVIVSETTFDEMVQEFNQILEDIERAKESIPSDYQELSDKVEGKMARYVMKLVKNADNTYKLTDIDNVELSFNDVYNTTKKLNEYVVVVYGNSKLRPQYVSTNEIMFIGLDRSTDAKVLRLLFTPTRITYETFKLMETQSTYTDGEKATIRSNIGAMPDASGNIRTNGNLFFDGSNGKIDAKTTDGTVRTIIELSNASNDVGINYNGYANNDSRTLIMGKDIHLEVKNKVKVNSQPLFTTRTFHNAGGSIEPNQYFSMDFDVTLEGYVAISILYDFQQTGNINVYSSTIINNGNRVYMSMRNISDYGVNSEMRLYVTYVRQELF